MVKLGVAIAHSGTIKIKTMMSIVAALKRATYEWNILEQQGSVIHVNRERLVKHAIKLGLTHLLFVDTDMSFGPDAVDKLLADNKDIIGVHYNCRSLPLQTTLRGVKEDKNLTQCEAAGTGLMLINLDVFKRIPEPWFFFKVVEGEHFGEDYNFCEKAKEAGYPIWADLSIAVKHEGSYFY